MPVPPSKARHADYEEPTVGAPGAVQRAAGSAPAAASLEDNTQPSPVRPVSHQEPADAAAGELPPTECWPELWVTEDHQFAKARSLVEAMLAIDMETASDWCCRRCGEDIEGQFSECWNCGIDRPMRVE